MKKLLLILLLAPLLSTAQTEIGFNIGATHYLPPNTISPDPYIGNNIETLTTNYEVGLDIRTKLSKRLFLGTGLQFQDRSFNASPYCGVLCNPYDLYYGFPPENNSSRLVHVSIPLRLGVELVQHDKFTLATTLGVQGGIRMIDNIPEWQSNHLFQYSATANAGLVLGWQLNEKLKLETGVEYRQRIKIGSNYNPSSINAFVRLLWSF